MNNLLIFLNQFNLPILVLLVVIAAGSLWKVAQFVKGLEEKENRQNIDIKNLGKKTEKLNTELDKQGIEINKQGIEINKQGIEINKQGIEINKQGIEINKQGIDIIEIKTKLNLILSKLISHSILKSTSPINLTDSGKRIAKMMKADNIINKNLKQFKKFIDKDDPKTPYDLQQTCFFVVDKNIKDILTTPEINIAKQESVKNGIPLDHTLSLFAILLRDKLLAEKGWKIK